MFRHLFPPAAELSASQTSAAMGPGVRRDDGKSRALVLKLPRRAKTPEILRGDRLQRIRGDAQSLQRQSCGRGGIGNNVVRAQQLDLVRRQFKRARRELQDVRLQPGQAE